MRLEYKGYGASRGYIVGIIEEGSDLNQFYRSGGRFCVFIGGGFFIHRVYGLFFEYSWRWSLPRRPLGMIGGRSGALYRTARVNLDAVECLLT